MATIPLDNRALRTILRRIGACQSARHWAHNLDLRTAWMTCERGNWLLWFATRLEVKRQRVVQAACRCGRLELEFMTRDKDRTQYMLEVTEAWCRGEATIEQVRSTYNNTITVYVADTATYSAARTAFLSIPTSVTAYAISTVAHAAARVVLTNPYAASDAADYVATHVADVAAAHANGDRDNPDFDGDEVVRENTLRQCADLVRQTIPYRSIAAAARRMLRANHSAA